MKSLNSRLWPVCAAENGFPAVWGVRGCIETELRSLRRADCLAGRSKLRKEPENVMKRLLRFAMVYLAALALVWFLPLYVERTMTRSRVLDHAGDVIEWGWRLTTLQNYCSNYSYFRPEEQPALWLAVNSALALTYALLIAISIDEFSVRWERRAGRPTRR